MERRAASHTEEEEMNQRRKLLNAAKRGDQKAIGKLFELYQVRVMNPDQLTKINKVYAAMPIPVKSGSTRSSRQSAKAGKQPPTKPGMQAKPAQVAKPVKAAKATKSTKPVKAAMPAKPIKSTKPVKAVKPAKPAKSTKPMKATKSRAVATSVAKKATKQPAKRKAK